MQNLTRNKIRLLLSLVPGIHLRGLQRALGISFNSTRYHIEKLAREGEVLRVDDSRYSRVYPAEINEADILLLRTLRSKSDRKILMGLDRLGFASNEQLRQITGLAKSTISEHLSQLQASGLLRVRQIGKERTLYFLSEPDRLRSIIREHQSRILEKAADRFVDLWNF